MHEKLKQKSTHYNGTNYCYCKFRCKGNLYKIANLGIFKAMSNRNFLLSQTSCPYLNDSRAMNYSL